MFYLTNRMLFYSKVQLNGHSQDKNKNEPGSFKRYTFSVPSIIPLKIYITNQVQYTYKYVAFSLPHYDLCKSNHGVYRGNYIDWWYIDFKPKPHKPNVSTICTKTTVINNLQQVTCWQQWKEVPYLLHYLRLMPPWSMCTNKSMSMIRNDLIAAERKFMYPTNYTHLWIIFLLWKILIQCTLTIQDFSPSPTPLTSNGLFINDNSIYNIIVCSNIRNLHKKFNKLS